MTLLYQNKYRVHTHCCSGWVYASPGAVFVTICTPSDRCYFSNVNDGGNRLNLVGEIVNEEINKTQTIRKNVIIDSWVIMPNHVHLIIIIKPEDHLETPRRGVCTEKDTNWKPGCLGAIVNHFKGARTRRIRTNLNPSFTWQPRFYDHIIRGDRDLDNLRMYISLNPENWRDGAPIVSREVPIYA